MARRTKDPICGMEVDRRKAVTLERGGQTYYFCNEDCRRQFVAAGSAVLERQEGATRAAQDAEMDRERLAAQAVHSHHGMPYAIQPVYAGIHARMAPDLWRRFWISLAVTLPIPILSPSVGLVGQFPGRGWILFLFSTLIYLYGGWPFLRGAARELQERLPGTMTLIAAGISILYMYSNLVQAHIPGHVIYWKMATVIDAVLLGHWIMLRVVLGPSRPAGEMARLMPGEVHLVRQDGSLADIPLGQLHPGDRVLVRPGERVPADGRIVVGESAVDEWMLTGRPRPLVRRISDRVLGGSTNGAGTLTIEVVRTGRESYLSQAAALVEQVEMSKSRSQGLADQAALILTVFVLGGACAVLGVWLALGMGTAFSVERMVAVMLIACPQALGLAITLVLTRSVGVSLRNGVVVRHRTAFENAHHLNTIVFDQTGTLTNGELGVRDESKEAVQRLQDLGLEVALLTGDREPAARFVAERLGLNTYFAEVPPDQKSEKIKALQGQGKKVGMVGDGVHDAPALTQADVGIAIGAGTDVAIETADVVLVESDPREVADMIVLSRLTHRKMVQNLLWATSYNVAAILVAAGVLYPIGVVLPPTGGAVLMLLSTILVAVNARGISYRKQGRDGETSQPVG